MLLEKFQPKRLWKSKSIAQDILNILLAGVYLGLASQAVAATKTETTSPLNALNARDALNCDREYNKSVLSKVDNIVRTYFYSKEMSKDVWPQALEKQKEKILNAKDLIELSNAINAAISELKTSHCRFLTINDDTYYFLYSLFSSGVKEQAKPSGICAFPGFITGGVGYEDDRVRFILDGSPAWKAGIRVADKILKIEGKKFVGMANFSGKGELFRIEYERDGKKDHVQATVPRKSMYDTYCKAVEKSARVFEKDGLKLGYVHLWCGGKDAQEEMEKQVTMDPIKSCDGLILDLRDGYGACSLDALDVFYRQPAAYPDFEMTLRDGKKIVDRSYFHKPMVALINGGSRSGKEMLALSLKRTMRAKVLGDTTAGYFVAGQLFPIKEKCALYLAVQDCALEGQRLEGLGVEPDLKVENDRKTSHDHQLETAKDELVKRIKEAKPVKTGS